MVLVNSGFPQAKEFVRKLSAIWARALQMFASPVLGPKKFKEYPFEGEPNSWPARGAHMSRASPVSNIVLLSHKQVPEISASPTPIIFSFEQYSYVTKILRTMIAQ